MNIPKSRLWIGCAVIFLAAICYLIYLVDQVTLPRWITMLYDFPNGDKVGHFLLMGVAAFLINMALSDRSFLIAKISIPYGPLIFAILVTLEEISQQFFPNRTYSLEDLAFSFAGILVLGILPSRLILRREKVRLRSKPN